MNISFIVECSWIRRQRFSPLFSRSSDRQTMSFNWIDLLSVAFHFRCAVFSSFRCAFNEIGNATWQQTYISKMIIIMNMNTKSILIPNMRNKKYSHSFVVWAPEKYSRNYKYVSNTVFFVWVLFEFSFLWLVGKHFHWSFFHFSSKLHFNLRAIFDFFL